MSNLWPVRRDERVSLYPCILPLSRLTTLTTLPFLRIMIFKVCGPLDSYNWSTPSWWPSSAVALHCKVFRFASDCCTAEFSDFLSSSRPSQPRTRSQMVVACFVLVLYLSVRNGQAETRFLSPVLQRVCVLDLVQAASHWSLCPPVTSL